MFKVILPAYWALSYCKIWKNPTSGSWDISLHYLGPKLAIWPNKGFFEKSHVSNFSLIILPYLTAKFEKILRADPEIKLCIILGHHWAIIAHFAKKKKKSIFWEIHFKDFTYLLHPIMLQSLMKILKVNPQIQACIILVHNLTKTAHLAKKMKISLEWYLSS